MSDDVLEPLGKLKEPLEALGELLRANGEDHRLLVVGGVAILARRVRERVTTDVDVIALGEVQSDGGIRLVPPDPLPRVLQESIHRVARDFGLPLDWLNTVIVAQWEMGETSLPPGLLEESSWHQFGQLHIGIAGRHALIALKLYAAADTGPASVHTQDLMALRPTPQELREAAEWAQLQDASAGFQTVLAEMVAHVRDNTHV